MVDSTVNSDVFYSWVKDGLIPELPEKSVLVMDNATFHKRADIVEILQKAGHDILWLPPYSPDLNPIEEVWAWVKSARERWKIDCIEKLFFTSAGLSMKPLNVPENYSRDYIVSIRYNAELKAFYETLLARGKAKKQAICAVMRKLVQICFGVIKHQSEYQP